MEIQLDEVAGYIRRVADRETVTKLAERLAVSRSTLYLAMKGEWPSKKICFGLGITLLVPDEGLGVKRRGKKAKVR
jgi:hypothetical protein